MYWNSYVCMPTMELKLHALQIHNYAVEMDNIIRVAYGGNDDDCCRRHALN